MTYTEAAAKLGKRDSRKLGNNTYLERRGVDIAVRLHSTDIVTFHPDGSATLNSGGWQTVTTKDRINAFSEARLYQKSGIWYVSSALYHDGMKIDADGNPINAASPERYEKAKKQIDKMVSAYIRGFIADAKENGIQGPSSGDCWGCCMRDVATGKTVMGVGHILEHFRENYYVPSLLINALSDRGDPASVFQYFRSRPEAFRTDLQRYFRRMKPALVEAIMKEEE